MLFSCPGKSYSASKQYNNRGRAWKSDPIIIWDRGSTWGTFRTGCRVMRHQMKERSIILGEIINPSLICGTWRQKRQLSERPLTVLRNENKGRLKTNIDRNLNIFWKSKWPLVRITHTHTHAHTHTHTNVSTVADGQHRHRAVRGQGPRHRHTTRQTWRRRYNTRQR